MLPDVRISGWWRSNGCWEPAFEDWWWGAERETCRTDTNTSWTLDCKHHCVSFWLGSYVWIISDDIRSYLIIYCMNLHVFHVKCRCWRGNIEWEASGVEGTDGLMEPDAYVAAFCMLPLFNANSMINFPSELNNLSGPSRVLENQSFCEFLRQLQTGGMSQTFGFWQIHIHMVIDPYTWFFCAGVDAIQMFKCTIW